MYPTEPDICDILRRKIEEQLTPLIDSDYIYLDLPYYSNIGDALIWMGTEHFLKDIPHKCSGRHSIDTFDFRPLPADTIILLNGGGNFGDIWRQHQNFRLRVIQQYPENPIIVLPQTVFYESEETLTADVQEMNRHRHLTICVRDTHSLELLKQKGFSGRLLTLPDMAFCIDRDLLLANKSGITKDTLLLLRKDKESPFGNIREDITSPELDIKDWPDLNKSLRTALRYIRKHAAPETDHYFQTDYLPERIREGVQFVSTYKMVFSTRLHVVILRLLLGLPVKITDNSYGKNLNFYNTWLKDAALVSILSEEEKKALSRHVDFYQQQSRKRRCRRILLGVIFPVLVLVAVLLFYYITH